MSSFPDNFSATKSSSEGTKSRGEPGVGFSSAFGEIAALLLSYRPRKDERVSWQWRWLAYSGRFTHINGYTHQLQPAGPVQASESSRCPLSVCASINYSSR